MLLIDKIVDQVISHPEQYDQSKWRSECGTVFCIGGWAVELAPNASWCTFRHGEVDVNLAKSSPESPAVGVEFVAAELLFTESWCENCNWVMFPLLFDARHTLDDVQAMVAEIKRTGLARCAECDSDVNVESFREAA